MKVNRLITAKAWFVALFLIPLAGLVSGQTLEIVRNPQWVAVKRQVLALKYKKNNQTTVNMSGTAIAPNVIGKADVEFKQGRTNIRVEMDSFASPQSLVGFYTAYILCEMLDP